MGGQRKTTTSTTLTSFFQLMKILGGVLVLEGLLWLLLQAVGPGTGFGKAVVVAMHVLGVATTLVVLSPIVGQLVTASIGQLLRLLLNLRALVPALKAFLFLHVILLLVSPWYLYFARAQMGWSKLTVAYTYAALVGAILGGMILLKGYLSKLKPSP